MALYKKNDLKNRAFLETKSMKLGGYVSSDINKAAINQLNESTNAFSESKVYDIFLSHSIQDAQVIYGLKLELEGQGYSVYVDWVDDKELNRSKVDKSTARLIRKRIKNCKCFIYAASEASKESNWMQWELGFADGAKKGKVAILPIEDTFMHDKNFYKYEYLGLYPYIDKAIGILWVNGVPSGNHDFSRFSEWLA
jgi:hypothetical protein